MIAVAEPFTSEADARRWLRDAGEERLAVDLRELNRALHAYRLVTADPYVRTVGRSQALVARIGYGEGEEVADGRWTDARELPLRGGRPRRARAIEPQARLAAVLTGREPLLVCEELVLRARLDVDQERVREGALQLLAALDGALAELGGGRDAAALADRLSELRERREAVAAAAARAVRGPLTELEVEQVRSVLARLEALVRARALLPPSRRMTHDRQG